MTKRIFIVLAVVAMLLPGCKKDSWIDWQLQNQLWVENIGQQPDIITTPTGLRYKVIREGLPNMPAPDDLKSVVVSYKGSLINGNVFDTTENGSMAMSEIYVAGFAEGLKLMRPTAHYILYIPYNIAYGTDGSGTEGALRYIPPYSTLVFDLTLISVY